MSRFFHQKAIASPEESKHDPKEVKTAYIERTRRAHQNDIENVYAFVFIATLYLVAVKPSYFVAKCCFVGFTTTRLIHTVVHLNGVSEKP